jgi:hypothetical protein
VLQLCATTSPIRESDLKYVSVSPSAEAAALAPTSGSTKDDLSDSMISSPSLYVGSRNLFRPSLMGGGLLPFARRIISAEMVVMFGPKHVPIELLSIDIFFN